MAVFNNDIYISVRKNFNYSSNPSQSYMLTKYTNNLDNFISSAKNISSGNDTFAERKINFGISYIISG
ncbi:hypothetical protein [Chryseobacterium sp. MYb328]|uniref:hypothetical protein n=1 Tax=Chryseobacterium sp. MYb328 TaxID=2745231 RepID=UPI00309C7D2E